MLVNLIVSRTMTRGALAGLTFKQEIPRIDAKRAGAVGDTFKTRDYTDTTLAIVPYIAK